MRFTFRAYLDQYQTADDDWGPPRGAQRLAVFPSVVPLEKSRKLHLYKGKYHLVMYTAHIIQNTYLNCVFLYHLDLCEAGSEANQGILTDPLVPGA